MIEKHGIDLRLNTRVSAGMLQNEGFDEVIVATGIKPRTPEIEGITHPKAVSYIDVITGAKPVGKTVAIMGAGGIGFDVAELITHKGKSAALDIDIFAKEWGIDFKNHPRGGVTVTNCVTEGTFSLDGETFDVENNVWVVGNQAECVVIDPAHDPDAVLAAVADRTITHVLPAADALEAGASGKDVDFYTGKIAAAQFFARTVLPRMASEKAITIAEDGALMDIPEAAF